MDDETNMSPLPRSSNPPLGAVAPDTIPSNPPKAERWVPYRNPYAQERGEDESSDASPASDTNETNENSVQPDEITSSIPADLVEATKRYAALSQSEEERDGTPVVVGRSRETSASSSLAMQRKRKRQEIQDSSKSIHAVESEEFEDCSDPPATVVAGAATSRTRKRGAGQSSRQARYDAQWEEMFQHLVEYKTKHNTTNVPALDPLLGKWVQNRRQDYKKGKLSQYRTQQLNSLGFQWKSHPSTWMDMYYQLLSYKERHDGSTNVPNKYNRNRKLGKWVHTQRAVYSGTACGILSKERIALLESIGFQWQLKERRPWMEMYKRLEKYKQEYNSTCVPQKYKADPQLGLWVSYQRRRCKKKERVDLLNKIGFVWKLNGDRHWMGMYKRLEKYKQEYNSTCVPQKYKADPQLGLWVSYQRQQCKKKELVDLLNRIGFAWGAENKGN